MEKSKTKDQFYEVEKIIDKRTNALGLTEYLVKWKDYPSSQNTWEPRKTLKHLYWTIKEFEDGISRDTIKKMKKGTLKGKRPDTPKKVIKIRNISNVRYCKIKWKKRRDNNYPTPSYIKYDIIKEKFPLLLLKFIERHLHLEENPDEKVIIEVEKEKAKKGRGRGSRRKNIIK